MSSTMVSEDGCQVHYADYVPQNVCNRWSVFCFVRVVPRDCCAIVWDCVHTTFQSFQNVTFTLQPVQWNGLWDESASQLCSSPPSCASFRALLASVLALAQPLLCM